MTRIIAGWAGSITLAVPGSGTRPTSDRVREAIFSALEARDAIDGMRVLDLYAGSGALGLEAASRGAAHVTLVDRVAAACKANAARILKQAPKSQAPTIVTTGQPVQAFLGAALNEWDLIFMDPPYEMSAAEIGHNLDAIAGILSAEGVLVLERSSRTPEPSWPAGLELERRKDYGDTALYWVVPAQPAEPSQPE